MKSKILALLVVLSLCSCKEDKNNNDIAQRDVQQYTIEQFMDNEAVGGGSFSHDNSQLLISSNRSGIYNAYTVPVKGGDVTPITQSDSTSYFANAFFPEDDRMLLSADGNGDEISHLYVRELDGSLKDITPVEGAKANFYGWSKDKKSLYYGSNKRDSRFFDVYKMAIDDYSSRDVISKQRWYEFRWHVRR